MNTTVAKSPSRTLIAWSTSCMLVAIDFLSRPNSVTVKIISSRLMSPFPSRSRAVKHSSASTWRLPPRTSRISSWNSEFLPSTTKDIQRRLAKASADRFFSKASMTIEWAEFGLKTFLPVISCATLPNTVIIRLHDFYLEV